MHPAVRHYLDDVERATLDLPWAQRRALLADLETRLTRRLGKAPSDADVAAALMRLGPPARLADRPARPSPWWTRLLQRA